MAASQHPLAHTIEKGVALLYSLLMVLAVPAICAAAKPTPEPLPVVSVSSVDGFQITPTTPPIITSGVGFSSGNSDSITLGSYAERGKDVVGGEYVWELFLHLGTAPLGQVGFPWDIVVTAADPWDLGVTNSAGIIVTSNNGVGVQPQLWVGSFPVEAEGDFYIGLVLRSRKDQPLSEALGVTVPFHVRIGETPEFLYGPDGNLRFTTTMTPGGAAFFDQGQSKKGHGRVTPVLRALE